ncbi:hypothetical protein pb186bvf_007648 [Paramecium bursaria]
MNSKQYESSIYSPPADSFDQGRCHYLKQDSFQFKNSFKEHSKDLKNQQLITLESFSQNLIILDISCNRIKDLDILLFDLQLKELYIQQNLFTTIPIQILKLRDSLQKLGLGWGVFCVPKKDVILQNIYLEIWFSTVTQYGKDLYFPHYLQLFSYSNTAPEDSVWDLHYDSQNLDQEQQHRKTSIASITVADDSLMKYINEYGQNQTHQAVNYDEIGILQLLLDQYVEQADQQDLKGQTPLNLALQKRNTRCIDLLLNYPLNVMLTGQLKYTNLHYAAEMLDPLIANNLIHLGSNPDAVDIFGDTPLHVASKQQDFNRVLDFFQEFLKNDIELNIQNLKGQSVLDILAEKGNLKVILFCNEWNIRNFDKRQKFNFQIENQWLNTSILDICCSYGYINIIQFLIDFNLVLVENRHINLLLNKNKYSVYVKILKKQQIIQLLHKLQNAQKEEIISINQMKMQQEQISDDSLSNLSCSSESKPFIIQQEINRMNHIKPKFCNSLKSKTSSLFINQNQDYELPPDDEVDSLRNFMQVHYQSQITKNLLDQGVRKRQGSLRFDKQQPRQYSFSPNNLQVIENRNRLIKPKQKYLRNSQRYAVITKKIGIINIQLQNHIQNIKSHNFKQIIKALNYQSNVIINFLNTDQGQQLQKVVCRL